ncbi:MAG: hypothetical protein U0166_18695 [Acidobacteriota bacterium]
MDLASLKVDEPERLVGELSQDLKVSKSVELACGLLARKLYEQCVHEGARSLVLSRIYLSLPFEALDPGSAAFAREKFGLSPAPGDLFLALCGTAGDEEAWCDRTMSQGHRAIPLNRETVTTVPMLARCFQQIGFDLDLAFKSEQGIHLEGVARAFGLFHVDDAHGSPFVPAQDGFVLPYGVRSALGSGTMLPNGAVSIWIGFARHAISRDAALPLIPMMPAFWHLVQPLYRKRAFFA